MGHQRYLDSRESRSSSSEVCRLEYQLGWEINESGPPRSNRNRSEFRSTYGSSWTRRKGRKRNGKEGERVIVDSTPTTCCEATTWSAESWTSCTYGFESNDVFHEDERGQAISLHLTQHAAKMQKALGSRILVVLFVRVVASVRLTARTDQRTNDSIGRV